MCKPKHVYEVYIRTAPEKLWHAITDAKITQKYFFGALVESDWKVGSSYVCKSEAGILYHDGKCY